MTQESSEQFAQPQEYYRDSVLGYAIGDLKYVLDRKELKPFVLLGPTFIGIDSIGGSLRGFSRGNSKERSTFVMCEYMTLSKADAEFIYGAMRCGMSHEANAKANLYFFNSYVDCVERLATVYHDDNGWLYLDCVDLARKTVAAAEAIWDREREKIRFAPDPSTDPALRDLSKVGLTNINELMNEFYKKANDPNFADQIPKDILGMFITSNSGFFDPNLVLRNRAKIEKAE